MDFRILGPLEVVDDGRPVALGKGKQRALLGLLLLHPNEVVSSDRLIDELWGERPPPTAQTALQGYVSQLRKLLGAERLETVTPGYRLRIAGDELDRGRFEAFAAEGRFAEALALWRGAALADLSYEPFAQAEIVRLEERRLTALEQRLDADLATGRHGEVVGELEGLVGEHPLRERFRAQSMLALYRSGRQAEALDAFQSARATLVEELGIEPGEELKELQRRILAQDAELVLPRPEPREDAPAPPAPPAPPRKVRKTVTILFCDLVDSTALAERLDAEVVESVLERFYEAAAGVITRHGGTVEKYAGDAVMAVFGLPRVHEDDALRALRAAKDLDGGLAPLREELQSRGLVLQVRVGVNSGEVVAGGETVVAGDAVNVAARLEEAAQAGEILMGDTTWRLVRGAVRAEQLQLALKGKSKPVRAWRLDKLVEESAAPHFEALFVGRDRELRRLRDTYEETVERRVPHLFTVLGAAGIGKTRLAHEFVTALDRDARVLTGRCLPYGEGITYWPLVEIGRELGEETARAALRARRDGALLAAHAVGALGLAQVPTARQEIFLAVRKLFEALARERPLVVVFEDIHWAEPTFLDLVEEVAEVSRDCALLVVCLARPELLEERVGWGGGKLNATSLLVDPLSEGESDLLIDRLLGAAPLEPDSRRRIAEAAEGNPLFVEQMLALLSASEQPEGELSVPPTIQALLAARLDRLGPGERAVTEAAAVVGKEFWAEAVEELLPDEAREALPRHLDGLVRKELVRPYRSPFFGADGFRFGHILIQDAAYRGIPKQLRAELHERFGSWLERRGDATEYIEILGYHYEQASLYRAELDPRDAQAGRLAETAAELLIRAGIRAGWRDWVSAEKLLERAVALLPDAHPRRARALLELGNARRQMASFEESRTALSDAAATARRVGDEPTKLIASMLLAADRFSLTGDAEALRELQIAAHRVAEEMAAAGDERWLACSLKLVGFGHLLELRFAPAEEALLRGLEAARRAGDAAEERFMLDHLAYGLCFGPTPVTQALERWRQFEGAGGGLSGQSSSVTLLYAMSGRFEEARRLAKEASEAVEETGQKIAIARNLLRRAEIEEAAGDSPAAERHAVAAHALAESAGHVYVMANTASTLARLMSGRGEDDEALRYTELSEKYGGGRSSLSQLDWKMTRAQVLARRGERAHAEQLAREVMDSLPGESGAHSRADHLIRYAEILEALGNVEEARNALAEALALAERKGDVVTACRARARMTELAASR